MTDSLQEKKSHIKGIAIIIISFLLVTLITILIMYFSIDSFRYKSNDFLTLLPGSAGEYFKKLPTKEEKESIKIQIAKHYINFEEDRLVDKLLIVKGEDNDLYNELLILLSKENPMKMRSIKEKLRNSQLQSSLLSRIVEEIDQDKMNKIIEITDYYSSLKITDVILEIEKVYNSEQPKIQELTLVFENLPRELSANILTYLDSNLSARVLNNLKEATKKEIGKIMQEINAKQNELKQLAKIYEIEPFEEKTEDLGTTNKYKAEDLAVIYKHMSIKSSAQILAQVEDNEFITTLYDNINSFELLNHETDQLSPKLADAIQIYKKYDSKVEELTGIYQRMSLEELTNIIQRMATNNEVYNTYVVGNEEIIFTEEQLVLDILSKLKPSIAAQLLEKLRLERSVDLSEKYVLHR